MDAKNQGNTVVLGRILANTVEQFLLFTSSTLILSIYLIPDQMRLIPIFVVTWVIGRMVFDYGYKISPLYRGPGFALTLIPTVVSLTLLAYHQYQQGPLILSLIAAFFGLKRFYLFLLHNEGSALKMIIG